MFGLFRKNSKPGGFWDWLGANTKRIQSAVKLDTQAMAEEIGREFKRSYPDLVWEVSPVPSGPWLFCVSANGDRELFPQVLDAVRNAPEVPGWKVQAFRPRGSLTAVIEMGGRTLGYEDIWCDVHRIGDGVKVTLLVRGMTPDLVEVLTPPAFVLLDNAVGEYDAVVKIAELDCGPLPSNPVRRDDLFPLAELPAYLDGIKEAKTPA
ncbi:MAG: hypothetical protein U0746_21975 [Gemmataceae bacterium]